MPADKRERALPTIDVDELFEAMTVGDNVVAYLNPATAAIEYLPPPDWDEEDDDRSEFDSWHVVEQVENSRRYQWRCEFADSLSDAPEVARELGRALNGRGAFGRFGRTIDEHPDLLARWMAFRAERMLECAKSWLRELDLHHPLSESRALRPPTPDPPTEELGLIHLLLLGAPADPRERVDGKVKRSVEARDAKRGEQLFRRMVRHACAFEGIAYRRSLADGRKSLTIGDFEFERRGKTVEVQIPIAQAIWDAFT